jgi:hypothetical protein
MSTHIGYENSEILERPVIFRVFGIIITESRKYLDKYYDSMHIICKFKYDIFKL